MPRFPRVPADDEADASSGEDGDDDDERLATKERASESASQHDEYDDVTWSSFRRKSHVCIHMCHGRPIGVTIGSACDAAGRDAPIRGWRESRSDRRAASQTARRRNTPFRESKLLKAESERAPSSRRATGQWIDDKIDNKIEIEIEIEIERSVGGWVGGWGATVGVGHGRDSGIDSAIGTLHSDCGTVTAGV